MQNLIEAVNAERSDVCRCGSVVVDEDEGRLCRDALKAGFNQIDVELLKTATGAAITYTTQNPELVSAIHLWFEAQTSDHGSHAEHNP